MPLHARVPTKLVVDATRLEDDELTEALDVALTRAVRTAVATTLDGRPEGTRVLVHDPEVQWLGSGLPGVASARRAATDAAVRAAVTAALARAGIVDGVLVRPVRGHREPVMERRDSSRHHLWLDRYTLPSYGGGKKQAVKVKDQVKTGGVMVVNDAPAPTAWRMAKVSEAPTPEIRRRGLENELEHRWVTLPDTGKVGAMVLADDGSGIYVAVFDIATEKEETSFGVALPLVRLRAKADGTLEEVPMEFDPNDVFHAKALPAGTDPKKAYRVHFRKSLIQSAKALQPKLPTQTAAEYDKDISDKVDQRIDEMYDARHKDNPISRIVLFNAIGGDASLIMFDAATATVVPAELNIDVYPIRIAKPDDTVELPGGEGEGAGAKQAEGKKEGAGVPGGTGGPGEGGPGGGFVVAPPDDTQPQDLPGSAFIGTLPGGGDSDTDVCAPWGGEPPIVALKGYSEELTNLMGQIARRLEMPVCQHAGAFVLAAAHMYWARAEQVGLTPVTAAGSTKPGGTAKANMGWVSFEALPTPQVQLLRHLAATTPLITRMQQLVLEAIGRHGDLIVGRWHDQPVGWQLHFLEEFTPAFSDAVAALFLMTCRVLFIQLLLASRTAIDEDLRDIENVASNFEQRILPLLEDVDKLTRLRDELRDHEIRQAQLEAVIETGEGFALPPGPVTHLEAPPSNWEAATEAVVQSLDPKAPPPPSSTSSASATGPGTGTKGTEGEIGEHKGIYYICDHRGRWHTARQLEDVITLARGTVESIDPLVKHIIELEDVLARMQDPEVGVKQVLTELLTEMQGHNEQIQGEAKSDVMFAFRASSISENIPAATVPYSRYALRGIHLQAHEAIGEFFQGDRFYALGIDHLFGTEQGYQALKSFGELVGVVLLSCIYAPLGIAVGIALAAHHYEEAVEKEHVYDALIDPDLVISRAEVEIQLFAAKLGLALSFLPVAGKALSTVRAVVTAGAVEAEEAVAAGSRAAAAEAAEEAVKVALRAAGKDVLEKFVTELATAIVVNKVLELALDPIMAAIAEAEQIRGPVGGLDQALLILLQRKEAAAKAASANATAALAPASATLAGGI